MARTRNMTEGGVVLFPDIQYVKFFCNIRGMMEYFQALFRLTTG